MPADVGTDPTRTRLRGTANQGERYIAMSMNAIFVQIEDAEIAGFEADPDSVERLFANLTLPTAGLLNMTAAMQKRVKAIGPQAFAETLSRLPEPLRQQIEASIGRTTAALASGQGGDDILKLMQQQLARGAGPGGRKREVLSLEKAWHGVHYLLAGTAEPGPESTNRKIDRIPNEGGPLLAPESPCECRGNVPTDPAQKPRSSTSDRRTDQERSRSLDSYFELRPTIIFLLLVPSIERPPGVSVYLNTSRLLI